MRGVGRTALLGASLLLWGCATGPTSDGGTVRDPNRISLEELQDQPAGTAYDAVERLRPNWLRSRASTMAGGGTAIVARVFVDGREFGPLRALRQVSIEAVGEIRYMSGRDATTRHGTGYAGGIIEVILKR